MPVVRPTGLMGPLGLLMPIAPPGNSPAHMGSTSYLTPSTTSGSTIEPVTGLAASVASRFAEAEAAGAAGLWVVDHLFWCIPMLDCLSTLAVAATATRRALLGTCVLQLPMRRPSAVAKQVATLQLLSGGRFVLGVGAGSHPGEYSAAGVEYGTRGRALDGALDQLRRCWAGTAGDGDRYRQEPVPEPVPVWVGGSSPAALERAALRGDGWVPLFLGPDDYRTGLARLRQLATRAGRDADRLAASVVVPVSLGARTDVAAERGTRWLGALYGLPPHAFARHLVAGDARRCAEHLRRYRDAGAEHLVVMVADQRAVEQFAEVAAALTDTFSDAGLSDAGLSDDRLSPRRHSPDAPRPEPLEVPA